MLTQWRQRLKKVTNDRRDQETIIFHNIPESSAPMKTRMYRIFVLNSKAFLQKQRTSEGLANAGQSHLLGPAVEMHFYSSMIDA